MGESISASGLFTRLPPFPPTRHRRVHLHLLYNKKTEPRRGPVRYEVRFGAYFACALRASMSASLRSVITPILLSR
jgi:hypothetical protein